MHGTSLPVFHDCFSRLFSASRLVPLVPLLFSFQSLPLRFSSCFPLSHSHRYLFLLFSIPRLFIPAPSKKRAGEVRLLLPPIRLSWSEILFHSSSFASLFFHFLFPYLFPPVFDLTKAFVRVENTMVAMPTTGSLPKVFVVVHCCAGRRFFETSLYRRLEAGAYTMTGHLPLGRSGLSLCSLLFSVVLVSLVMDGTDGMKREGNGRTLVVCTIKRQVSETHRSMEDF